MLPRVNRMCAVLAIACLTGTVPAAVAHASVPSGKPIPQAREVQTRSAGGSFATETQIPSGSTFATHGGGSTATCKYTSIVTTAGTIESGHWIFVEGVAPPGSFYGWSTTGQTYTPSGWDAWRTAFLAQYQGGVVPPVPSLGRLASAPMRTFTVYCDFQDVATLQGVISVSPTDPFFDPLPRATNLLNSLRLTRPQVIADASVKAVGGLVTRHPSWFAIGADGWGVRTSNVEVYRGWELSLVLRPVALDIAIEPHPTSGSDPAARLSCVSLGSAAAGLTVDAASRRFPARPGDLTGWSEPGPGAAHGLPGCSWTPGQLGTVTATATITYEVTFWISGYAEPLAGYTWSSLPATFPVGALSVVNVNNP